MLNNNLKIFITGPACCRIKEFANYITTSYPELLSYGKLTTTDKESADEFIYFTENQINEIFLNRQFVFLHDGIGLTTVELEENNLFAISFEELALIPNKVWLNNETLIVSLYPDETWQVHINMEYDDDLRKTLIRERDIQSHIKEIYMANKFMCMKGYTFLEAFARIIKFIETETLKNHKKLLDTEFPKFDCYKL